MAIKIKRSTGNTAPAELAAGQLAYVEGATNGGTLYYGEIGGTVREIAGRKYVDKLNGIEAGAQVNTVTSVAGRTGAVTIGVADVSGAEATANKGAANGYASLDANGLVPSTQLPSYVDDVLEYANLAAFPATGESAKIYVAIDTGKTYRWSGSVYVEISASPGSTDSVTEGSTNLYFTQARARTSVSVTDSGGDGSLSYDNTTGVFTYTGPSASDVRAHFSAGTGISITDGVIASTITQGITDIVQDTTPQLGGDLDLNGYKLTTTSNGNIVLDPNGTGEVILDSTYVKFGNSSGNATVGSQAGNLILQGQVTGTSGANLTLVGGTNGGVTIAPNGTGTTTISSGGLTVSSGNVSVTAGSVSASAYNTVRDTTTTNQFFMSQSHSTADANNFVFARTRGTFASQAAVQTGDDLIDFNIVANDGSSTTTTGLKTAYGFTSTVVDTPTTGYIPTRTDWFIGTAANTLTTYHSVSTDGIARFREIGVVSGVTNLQITAGTDGNITLAPNGTGRVILDGMSWPAADGTNGYVLTTNGSGNLSWAAQTAGVTAFTGLTDVPASFSGSAGYYVKVNSGATALEFSQDVDDGTF